MKRSMSSRRRIEKKMLCKKEGKKKESEERKEGEGKERGQLPCIYMYSVPVVASGTCMV